MLVDISRVLSHGYPTFPLNLVLYSKPPICQTARSQHSATATSLAAGRIICETQVGVVGGSPSVVQHPRLHQHEPKTGQTLHPSSLFFGSVFFECLRHLFWTKKTFTSKVYLPALDIRSHIWWTVLGVFVKGLACQLHSQKLWMQQVCFSRLFVPSSAQL